MPLYPTEEIIWDENIVPTAYFSGEGCLALPKLNLQFLTLHDYLLRNFNLFRLESTCKYIFHTLAGTKILITGFLLLHLSMIFSTICRLIDRP